MAELEIRLRVGDRHNLLLEGRGSAGYKWSFQMEGSEEAVTVEGKAVGVPPSEPMTYNMDQEYTIAARAPGRVRIRFELRRPWEDKAKDPLRVEIVDVHVRE